MLRSTSQAIVEAYNALGLKDPSLMNTWINQAEAYGRWWYWFDGNALEEKTQGPDPVYKFPLKINPIRWVCERHASLLFGEVPDSSPENLLEFQFKEQDGSTSDRTNTARDFVSNVWSASGGISMLTEAALSQQVCGGSVYKVSWDPLAGGVRISLVPVESFLPIWNSQNPWDLHGAGVTRYITPYEARELYGYTGQESAPVHYVEWWDKQSYRVLVGGKQATYRGTSLPMAGENIWKSVPFVYIPHLFRAGLFYGRSHVPSLIGLTEEINARMADVGDKIRAGALNAQWARDVRSGINIRRVGQMLIYDLGSSFPDGKNRPEIAPISQVETESAIAGDHISRLWEMISHDSAIPLVAWGIDEGSQRSGATLEIRMHSLSVHIAQERLAVSQGLMNINRLVLQLGARNGLVEDYSDLQTAVNWHPILPRERNDLVDEVVQRLGVHAISVEHALQLLSRGEDLNEHYQQILKDLKEFAPVAQPGTPTKLGPPDQPSQTRARTES